jgi:hypothetical protein
VRLGRPGGSRPPLKPVPLPGHLAHKGERGAQVDAELLVESVHRVSVERSRGADDVHCATEPFDLTLRIFEAFGTSGV